MGEEQSLKEIVSQHKSEIKTNTLYKVKKAETGGKQLLIMERKTAEKMVEIGVLRESDNDNEVWSSDPIKSLPSAPKGKAVLLASKKNKKIKELTINEKKIEVQYASDTWFGHYRNSDYEELIVIVDNTTFNQIPVNETSIGEFFISINRMVKIDHITQMMLRLYKQKLNGKNSLKLWGVKWMY